MRPLPCLQLQVGPCSLKTLLLCPCSALLGWGDAELLQVFVLLAVPWLCCALPHRAGHSGQGSLAVPPQQGLTPSMWDLSHS